MRVLLAAFMVALSLTAVPARADVTPEFCSQSKEGTYPPPIWPYLLVRFEVEVKDGAERIVSTQQGLGRDVVFSRMKTSSGGYANYALSAPSPIPRQEGAPDGRYAVIGIERKQAPSPSYREHYRDCYGKDWNQKPWLSVIHSLAVARCDGACSSISTQSLLDGVYGPVETRDVDITYKSSPFVSGQGIPPSRGFVLLDPSIFDVDRLTASRGSYFGGVFHPERFKARVQMRLVRPDKVGWDARLPLITRVLSISACPSGDIAALCAPDEAASRKRRVQGYPASARFGTGQVAPPAHSLTSPGPSAGKVLLLAILASMIVAIVVIVWRVLRGAPPKP